MKNAPTKSGAASGVDSGAGVPWSFEPALDHWRHHETRELAYWRSRTPEERLAQAARYRVRVHGPLASPLRWPWRFVAPGE